MSCVFQNIDPPPPSPPGECVPPAVVAGEGHTRRVERGVGWGVNILEDARHSSVLYLYRILLALLPSTIWRLLTLQNYAFKRLAVNVTQLKIGFG
jgi:hypothetical protein